MLIVAGSGVIGRFLYMRVNRGLSGEKTSLKQLEVRAGGAERGALKLHFAPEVEARLLKFAEDELHAKPGWLTHLRRITVLPLQQRAGLPPVRRSADGAAARHGQGPRLVAQPVHRAQARGTPLHR